MSRKTITFANDTEKFFAANPRQLAGYMATIQNNTTQTINITVTNQSIRGGLPGLAYSDPGAVALDILAGKSESLSEPYQGWKITATATTGTVDITEMG